MGYIPENYRESNSHNGAIFLSNTSIELVLPNTLCSFNDMYTRMIDGNICEIQCPLPL